MSEIPEGLTPALDAKPAEWVIEGLVAREHTVRSLVPDGFEAHSRVLHPAYSYELDANGYPINQRWVRWAEIAELNGTTMHAEAQFEAITGLDRYNDQTSMDHGQPPLWRAPAGDGSLDLDVIKELVPILGAHTDTREHCYFAHWGGFGYIELDRTQIMAWFGYPWPNTGRDHMLFQGPVGSAAISLNDPPFHFQSPNVWWPEDQAWLVATDIDLDSTYIGGSAACIEAICSHPDIEALRTEAHHVVTRDGDKINPPLQPLRRSDPPKRKWFWRRWSSRPRSRRPPA